MSEAPVRVLLIEDNPGDIRLVREFLGRTGGLPRTLPSGATLDLEIAEELSVGLARLAARDAPPVQAVLLDLTLPDSWGLDTFTEVHARAPNVACIVLTSLEDESLAAQALRMGAQDYLVKGRVNGEMLARSVYYALERKKAEAERERLIAELKEALAKVKTLGGLIPICSSCKMIRDDRGYWNQLEAFIQSHSEASFSHGLCPACIQRLYPDYADEVIGGAPDGPPSPKPGADPPANT